MSFLHRMMIDGVDIEDDGKDRINSFQLGELQTTKDVFPCETEDSADIEEIGLVLNHPPLVVVLITC